MKKILALTACCFLASNLFGQKVFPLDLEYLEYEVKVGLSIGGASPIPLPAEIRSIRSYNPRLNLALEGAVTYWIDDKWGVSSGLRLERKGMTTEARVKNYSTEVIDESSRVAGYWTGLVHTEYSSWFLTLPVLANYYFASDWIVRAGLYASLKTGGDFSGYVTDGYLRQGAPTGPKVEFKDGKKGTYDFSKQLRTFQAGVQAGGTWQITDHISVNADLTWAFTNIFKSGFKTVAFNMYPIYLTLGAGYLF